MFSDAEDEIILIFVEVGLDFHNEGEFLLQLDESTAPQLLSILKFGYTNIHKRKYHISD